MQTRKSMTASTTIETFRNQKTARNFSVAAETNFQEDVLNNDISWGTILIYAASLLMLLGACGFFMLFIYLWKY